MKPGEREEGNSSNDEYFEYWQRYWELRDSFDRSLGYLAHDETRTGITTKDLEELESSKKEEVLLEIAEEYQNHTERVERRRIESKRKLSLLLYLFSVVPS